MKIFNKEDGIEKVYVQKKDIIALENFGIKVPLVIIKKSLDIIGMDDFIEFTSPSAIAFFKRQELIVDYKLFRDYQHDILEEFIKKKEHDLQMVLDKINSIPVDYSDSIESFKRKYDFLKFQYEDLKKIYSIKLGDSSLKLPLVPDSNGFSLESDNLDNPFKLCISLDPNKYLLFKKDNIELSENEQVPINFVQGGLCIALMNRKDSIPNSGDCVMNSYLTEDHKILVMETKIIEKKEEILKHQEEKPKVKGIRRILNRIFYKDK